MTHPDIACGQVVLHVDVVRRASSSAPAEVLRAAVEAWLNKLTRIPAQSGPLAIPIDDPLLFENTESVFLEVHAPCPTSSLLPPGPPKAFYLPWEVSWRVQVFHLHTTGPEDLEDDDDDGEGGPSFRQWDLPSSDFHGLWESLHFDSIIKSRLLCYADSALLFGEKGVDAHLVAFGRVVLLHGPPGTGKTSLCKALAQKLAMRWVQRPGGTSAVLVDVNAHSLFSRWFSESGKLVAKMFGRVREALEEEGSLVCVLVDEVESLAAARTAAGSGGEPGDAVRAVNALLTQLDQLRQYPNCLVLTTSNISGAIDVAFIDRADIKAYIGPPTVRARFEMLKDSLGELIRVGIVGATSPLCSFAEAEMAAQAQQTQDNGRRQSAAGMQVEGQGDSCTGDEPPCERGLLGAQVLQIAEAAQGLSGRALRKLPFLAHAGGGFVPGEPCPAHVFMAAMAAALNAEKEDRVALEGNGK